MILIPRKRVLKTIALLTLFSMVNDLFFTPLAFALTSGPNQPEFSSFEPVGTTDMVNEFTGDFTYNLPILEVPGPHGSSYPLSLSYHSGATPEEEASWVGYGWTLNPGAITRNTRGFPDDYNGQDVKFHNKMPDNWTVTAGGGVQAGEVFGIDVLSANANASLRYNNYRGFGYSAGLGATVNGVVSLGYNVSDGEGSFSLNINPMGYYSKKKVQAEQARRGSSQGEDKTTSERESVGQQIQHAKKNISEKIGKSFAGSMLNSSSYGLFSHTEVSRPINSPHYSGNTVNFTVGLLGTPSPFPAGVSANIFGKFSKQQYDTEETLGAYGYMYAANAGSNSMMDYHTEKENAFDKRDVFLGIPFNDADNFLVSGQNIGGGFRMYHKKIGQFGPNTKSSATSIINIGGEVEAGLNFGVGGDVGGGKHTLKVTDWERGLSQFSNPQADTIDEPVFFRFNNDLGGSWEYQGDEDEFLQANLLTIDPSSGHKSFFPYLDTAYFQMNSGQRSGRSSYIGYHTNTEINQAHSSTNKYLSYSNRSDLESLTKRTGDALEEGIGEMTIYNESGMQYTYGLPVYSRNEKNLQYGLQGLVAEDNYLVYGRDNKTKFGEEHNQPYANTYLLTEINTTDYIDRTLDGPTVDDFGGFVKFDYKKKYGYNGESSSWYHWRFPYTGLRYSRGSLSDSKDDLGSVSEGEKEIFYLKDIQTKTHKAIFYTSARSDGKDAVTDPETAINNSAAKGLKTLEKLDKIELYSLKYVSGAPVEDKLIKTIYFDYDYSLSQGVDNAASGKLTLKKITFEYQGIQESRISYAFGYQYPDFSKYPARYQDLPTGYSHFISDDQNPDYDAFNIDAWGNYQYEGRSRYDSMKTWVDQKYYPANDAFDPAAWQLKTITLPSGGEIHIQYEQDDYTYVQDQQAHVMASINSVTGNKYYLNTDEIGISNDSTVALASLEQMLKDRYISQDNKIYFKFLYRLIGLGVTPELDNCNAEYITGYADVVNVGSDGGGVYVELASGNQHPDKVCIDFVKTQRAGNVEIGGNCDASTNGIDPDKGGEKIVRQLLSLAKTLQMGNLNLCATQNLELSYLRVPTPLSKKGGGIRVKRLLMYDEGFEGQAVLYGHEYDYNFYDKNTSTVRSSGVATNEPAAMREENILVDFIAREKQSLLSKIIAGRDKEQSEGPLGESVLPGPIVGYGRVTKRNIHSGVTNPGFTVSEYYTAKDFPVEMEKTNIQEKTDYLPIPTGLVNTFVNNVWATQGFRFIINNMHGQVKSMATYGGDYNDIYQLTRATLSAKTTYEYYKQGEKIPIMRSLAEGITMQYPGKEVDVTFAQKAVKDELTDGNIEGDASIGLLPIAFIVVPLPFITAVPSLTFSETELYTHATSKVIRYPAIVKKVTSYADGITHVTENQAFDAYTGKPVAVKSSDDFEQKYINIDFTAAAQYPALGQKAMLEGLTVYSGTNEISIEKEADNTLNFSHLSGGTVCDLLDRFTPGDQVALHSLVGGVKTGLAGIYHLGAITGNRIALLESKHYAGNSYTGEVAIEVVRSARTNQLNESAGSFTAHNYNNVTQLISNVQEVASSIPSEELGRRNDFVDLLNNKITPSGGSISPLEFQEVQLTTSNGGCSGCIDHLQIVTGSNEVELIVQECSDANRVFNASLDYAAYCGQVLDEICNSSAYGGSGATIYEGWSKTAGTPDVFDDGNEKKIRMWRRTQTNGEGVAATLSNPLVPGNEYVFSFQYAMDKNGLDQYKPVLDSFYVELSESDAYEVSGSSTTPGAMYPDSVLINGTYQTRVWKGVNIQNSAWDSVSINFTAVDPSKYIFFDIAVPTVPADTQQFVTYRKIKIAEVDPVGGQSTSFVAKANGSFDVDGHSGKLIFVPDDSPCHPIEVSNLQFCDDYNNYPYQTLENVIASNAQTFSDDWDYSPVGYTFNDGNVYENGEKGKWRVNSSYTYNTDLYTASKNYQAGRFALELFNWQQATANDAEKWLRSAQIDHYSPQGEPLQQRNILDIPTAAKFGYYDALPYLTTQNARYREVFFESFENDYSTSGDPIFEDNYSPPATEGSRSSTYAHAGSYAWQMGSTKELILKTFNAADYDQGMLLKFWMKVSPEYINELTGNIKITESSNMYDVAIVAKTGEWALGETYISNLGSGNFTPAIQYLGEGDLWVDDVRVQPADAQMSTFVYDPHTLRLLTLFDDQHFGLYYQYNVEGKLIRKQVETERGIRTIEETHYNTPSE